MYFKIVKTQYITMIITHNKYSTYSNSYIMIEWNLD